MIWHDEFDGTRLEEAKWICRQEGRRRDGCWSRKAISLDGQGHLVVSIFRESEKYTDGCVATQDKFEHA